MNVAVLAVGAVKDADIGRLRYKLSLNGFDAEKELRVPASADLKGAFNYLRGAGVAGDYNGADGADNASGAGGNGGAGGGATVFVFGDLAAFKAQVLLPSVSADGKIFTFGGDAVIPCESPFTDAFYDGTVFPALAGGRRTYYISRIFKTFGKTVAELREILKEQIKNKNRIAVNVFSNFEADPDAETRVRYSNKTPKAAADDALIGVATALNPYLYAGEDVTLFSRAAELLTLRGKTLSVAESYTGGAIAAGLVLIPGASAFLRESLVAYSNDAKIKRLGVNPDIIKKYGAVSIETAYEMASGLFVSSGADYVIATTGNAGPAAEKEGEQGVCYTAVGDADGIHIYPTRFNGDRSEVIISGVKDALYRLIKKLKTG